MELISTQKMKEINHEINHDLKIHSSHNLWWMPKDKVLGIYNFGEELGPFELGKSIKGKNWTV